MYSAGLPILYPFAAIFYFILYWVYKGLLLKFYEKTTKFNEELPLYTTQWTKIGVLLHGAISLVMFTNSQLIPNNNFWDMQEDWVTTNYGSFAERVSERFHKKDYAVVYLSFWIGVVCWFVFEATLWEFIWAIIVYIREKVTGVTEEEKAMVRESAWSDDFYKELKIEPLKKLWDKASDEIE